MEDKFLARYIASVIKEDPATITIYKIHHETDQKIYFYIAPLETLIGSEPSSTDERDVLWFDKNLIGTPINTFFKNMSIEFWFETSIPYADVLTASLAFKKAYFSVDSALRQSIRMCEDRVDHIKSCCDTLYGFENQKGE